MEEWRKVRTTGPSSQRLWALFDLEAAALGGTRRNKKASRIGLKSEGMQFVLSETLLNGLLARCGVGCRKIGSDGEGGCDALKSGRKQAVLNAQRSQVCHKKTSLAVSRFRVGERAGWWGLSVICSSKSRIKAEWLMSHLQDGKGRRDGGGGATLARNRSSTAT